MVCLAATDLHLKTRARKIRLDSRSMIALQKDFTVDDTTSDTDPFLSFLARVDSADDSSAKPLMSVTGFPPRPFDSLLM